MGGSERPFHVFRQGDKPGIFILMVSPCHNYYLVMQWGEHKSMEAFLVYIFRGFKASFLSLYYTKVVCLTVLLTCIGDTQRSGSKDWETQDWRSHTKGTYCTVQHSRLTLLHCNRCTLACAYTLPRPSSKQNLPEPPQPPFPSLLAVVSLECVLHYA